MINVDENLLTSNQDNFFRLVKFQLMIEKRKNLQFLKACTQRFQLLRFLAIQWKDRLHMSSNISCSSNGLVFMKKRNLVLLKRSLARSRRKRRRRSWWGREGVSPVAGTETNRKRWGRCRRWRCWRVIVSRIHSVK